MKKIVYIALLAAGLSLGSCNYLDVIPDNITTIDMAFNNRTNARKYLATCYNFLPRTYDMGNNASISCADDYCPYLMKYDRWDFTNSWSWARGLQNSSNPLFNYWSGANYFRGVHECNVFLANVDKVPDLSYSERNRWKAEVYTLKAFYLYWLFLHYGPIPLLDENIDINSDLESMIQYREKVDDVVNYMVELLDKAIDMDQGLPMYISSVTTEMGRITLPAAHCIKAKVLVTAASPLFNGNTDYADFLDPRDRQPFFNQTYSQEKWSIAAEACKKAIDISLEGNHDLFEFNDRVAFQLTPETKLEMTLREIVTSRYNCEQVFAPGSTDTWIQGAAQPRLTTYDMGNREWHHLCQYSPTLNIIEEYYTENGVPIEEDKSLVGTDLYELATTPSDRPAFFVPNYTTAKLHLNREPRFYANIGFDGGKWFNSEVLSPEEAYGVNSKKGGIAGDETYRTSATGYFIKKVCSYKNMNTAEVEVLYAFPNTIIRLADIYLLYSEALNESLDKPNDEVYKYIQLVRHRAGLDKGTTLQDTWSKYSVNPNKPLTKEGMREIIHRERLIEMQFEGKRLNDLRRWKKCGQYFNAQMRGLNIMEETPELFYVPRVIYTRSFSVRDYLWPLAQGDLNKNTRLVQNPLW
ncbi:RagB/SusD family nutrient uptake outer membrane protein [Bacteroides bouchesdurhonensis]|uniref:RagB/SusD family nutrient uptake outer membrane protein n=1 Tax=Bacteroides bouchesdurhonensis TaxID=1841855 RepID=UPI00097F7ECF|nr:RagB/SusD family nutrient uptake outer membrane protein [Bacteroides bouchesdurhonensis]